MSKYCINCGRTLEDNQTCSCSIERSTVFTSKDNSFINLDKPNSATNMHHNYNKPDNFKEFMHDMLNIFINFYKSPDSEIKKLVHNKNVYASMFFILVQFIIAVVFSLITISNIIQYIINKHKIFDYELSRKFINPAISFTSSDYFTVFVKSSLTYLILLGALCAIIYLLKKSAEHFMSLLTVIGISSIPLTTTMLLSMILIQFNNSTITFLSTQLIFIGVLLSFMMNFKYFKQNLSLPVRYENYLICLILGIYYFIILSMVLKII